MVVMLFGPNFDPALLRRSGEKDEEYYSRLRKVVDPDRQISGIPRNRIEQILRRFGRGGNRNEVSVVAALLDDDLPNGYPSVQEAYPFSTGASTSHIFCHAGILQHGEKKIDRENRDYLIKPLTELGIIEPVYLEPQTRSFVPGHPTPKSPNNCHRLTEEFRTLLSLRGEEFEVAIERWTSEDATHERARLQAAATDRMAQTEGSHANLVRAALEFYAPRFLPGYQEVYTDLTDGDRISEEQREALRAAGLEPSLADPSPDALLSNEDEDAFWVIGAVTSDGEVDLTKVEAVQRMIARRGRPVRVGFTTAYRTWRDAGSRQERVKNMAPGTYVWVQSDASRQLKVEDVSSPQPLKNDLTNSSDSP
jgi:hypothetical protein